MTSRSPLPWVLSWDANGELANHDRYDLLQADAALCTECARVGDLLRQALSSAAPAPSGESPAPPINQRL